MIIKKIIWILFILPVFLFPQEKTDNQSIELPSFVITGIEKIIIPKQKKRRPKLIPTLDSTYFNPFISPEKMTVSAFSRPQSVKVITRKEVRNNNGQIEVGAGIYVQPTGNFSYHVNKGNTHLFTNIAGINIRDYVPLSKYNSTDFKLGSDFDISRNSSFLSGSKISLEGNYKKEQYHLYASSNPEIERKNEYFTGEMKIQNYYSKKINYLILGKINNLKFHESGLQETTLESKAELKYAWRKVSFKASGEFKTQSTKNSFVISNNNYMYGGKAVLHIEPSNDFNANIGAVYYKQDGNQLIKPVVELTAMLDKGISLIAKYEPYASFETLNDFQNDNKYLKIINVNNLFVKNDTDFSLFIRYQNYKYFEINGGVNYQLLENSPYYEGGLNFADLELKTSDYVKRAALFVNLLFFKGPYGQLFGNVELQSVKFRNGNYVPYEPILKTDFSYNYDLMSSVNITFKLRYYSKAFIDAVNLNKIPEYIGTGIEIKYSLQQNIKLFIGFENLLNRNNFVFSGYKEKPFDIIGGINYAW